MEEHATVKPRAPSPHRRGRPGNNDAGGRSSPLKAAEALAHDIVEYIHAQDLPAGARLPPERRMLEETGRARSTLREALRLLETRGVIQIKQGTSGGPVVRRPRPSDLGEALTLILRFQGASPMDIINAREEMEALSAARAATRISTSDLDALQESVDLQLACLDDNEVFLTQSRRFHTIINAAAGNPVLAVLNEALQTTTHAAITEVRYDSRHRRTVALAHRAVIEAMRKGDAAGAEAAMRRHVQQSGQYWSKATTDHANQPVGWLRPGDEISD